MRFICYSILLCCIMLVGCGQPSTEPATTDASPEAEKTPAPEQGNPHLDKILYTLPSPFETLTLLREADAAYSTDFLFDPARVNEFDGSIDKAVVLGIYGADLSYVSVFEDNQSSIKYLAAVTSLMKDLRIGEAFSAQTMQRLLDNSTNADSVQQIVSHAYYQANGLLKEDAQEHLAAIVLAGGWLEGLYIATRLAESNPDNEVLLATITDQKYALENLQELLKSFDSHQSVSNMSEQLGQLNGIFERATQETETTVEQREQDGKTVTVIGGGLQSNFTDSQLSELTSTVAELRTSLLEQY